LKNIITVFINF